MNRRDFILRLAGGTLALPSLGGCTTAAASDRLGPLLPQRPLGRSGTRVTALGLGGFHIGWIDRDATAQAVIETALEEGVRFFDSAESYSAGRSEERFGRFLLQEHRESVFFMTKTNSPDAATARRHLEGSLRRCRTDYLDLWQVHTLKSAADARSRLDNGVFDELLKAREEGKVRHIGFTGHRDPGAFLELLAEPSLAGAFETCQMPVNPVDAAAKRSFLLEVLPELRRHGFGVLAMKTLADGRFFDQKRMNDRVVWTSGNPVIPTKLSIPDCIHFALSLPVSVLITGAEDPAFVREKARLLRQHTGMTRNERLALAERVADFAAAGQVEYYKAPEIRG
jgi:aryl-alcohol dehydrogenase-like predicted oxidoreductase